MLLTGKPISAPEALQSGLISKMVKDIKELDIEVNDITDAINTKPRAVIELGKNFYYKQLELSLSGALKEGSDVMVQNLAFKDAQEGLNAFKEKRLPVWSHTDEKV